jgi:replicative DNA helicase
MPRKPSRHPSEVAEEALIAGILHTGSVMVHDKLKPDDFIQPSMATSFHAAMNLFLSGLKPTAETVATEATNITGSVMIDVPTLKHIQSTYSVHGDSELMRLSTDIVKFSHMRRVKAACQAAIRDIEASGVSTEDLVDKLQTSLVQVYNSKSEPMDEKAIAETVVNKAIELKRTGLKPGDSTGIRDLDKTLLWLCPGRVVVIAGRPGMGKTSLMDNIVSSVTDGDPMAGVYLASLEFTEEQGMSRKLSTKTGIPFDRIVTGELSDQEISKLVTAATLYKPSRVFVDTSATVDSMREFCSKARRLKSKMATKGIKLKLVAIDSVQLFAKYDGSSREQAIAAISNMAKKLAMELDVVVLLLSALNRDVERREVKRPQLSDLRESGAIEQDADQVIMVHRQGFYDHNAPNDEAELLVVKNRWGKTQDITVRWDGETYRFSNYP